MKMLDCITKKYILVENQVLNLQFIIIWNNVYEGKAYEEILLNLKNLTEVYVFVQIHT